MIRDNSLDKLHDRGVCNFRAEQTDEHIPRHALEIVTDVSLEEIERGVRAVLTTR